MGLIIGFVLAFSDTIEVFLCLMIDCARDEIRACFSESLSQATGGN
jgi:hypothetical protein